MHMFHYTQNKLNQTKMSNNLQDKNVQKQYEKYTKKLEAEYEEKLQTKLLEEKKKFLDSLIKFKPQLEKEKKILYEKLIHPNEKKVNDVNTKNNPIILDQFIHKGTKYYKDDMGCVWDSNANPVGSIEQNNGDIKCVLFDEEDFSDDNSQLPTLGD